MRGGCLPLLPGCELLCAPAVQGPCFCAVLRNKTLCQAGAQPSRSPKQAHLVLQLPLQSNVQVNYTTTNHPQGLAHPGCASPWVCSCSGPATELYPNMCKAEPESQLCRPPSPAVSLQHHCNVQCHHIQATQVLPHLGCACWWVLHWPRLRPGRPIPRQMVLLTHISCACHQLLWRPLQSVVQISTTHAPHKQNCICPTSAVQATWSCSCPSRMGTKAARRCASSAFCWSRRASLQAWPCV